ncbi:hypothetical protein C2E23DRAFT_743953 [Lenzites betulinus]|nr:hypothetical protein C2E23DRAFT_743953 [Lenzites betulinus]
MALCIAEYEDSEESTLFDDEDAEDPEYDMCPDGLGLPSDYHPDDCGDYGLHTLADYERIIRIGLAFDQLDAVRIAIKHRAAHLTHKRKNVRGTKANHVAQEEINKADLRARLLAGRYNHNLRRINDLRPTNYDRESDATAGARLQLIDLDHDLAIANMAAPQTLNDSKRSGSWLWAVYATAPSSATRTSKATQSNSDTGVDVVQWFRAKAEKDRADEAVNRLCAEFRRTRAGYRAYASMWETSATTRHGGERAYALKTATMWSSMADECEREYDGSRRPDAPAAPSDVVLIHQEPANGVRRDTK